MPALNESTNQPEPSFQDDFGAWLQAHGVKLALSMPGQDLGSPIFNAQIDLNQLKAAIVLWAHHDKAQAVAEARLDEQLSTGTLRFKPDKGGDYGAVFYFNPGEDTVKPQPDRIEQLQAELQRLNNQGERQ